MSEGTSRATFERWIGRPQTHTDVVTHGLVDRFRATLSPHLIETDPRVAPLLIHWCLAPEAVPDARLGPDGHPEKGDFLPPVPLPRRMWAGGRISFRDQLLVGDTVERTSTVASIKQKSGRTGALWFVEVEHVLSTGRGVALEELQTIVYRQTTSAAPAHAESSIASAHDDPVVDFSAVRLFRYSALTFNSHRIHYDRTYALETENYEGLVVHGPLQATLLAHAAAKRCAHDLQTIEFRGRAQLIGPSLGTIRTLAHLGSINCNMCDSQGNMTMHLIAT